MSIRLFIILAALIAMPAWAQDASWPNKPGCLCRPSSAWRQARGSFVATSIP